MTAQAQKVDIVSRMFRAMERGDFDTFRACYSDDAVCWHNSDGIEVSIDDNCKILAGVLSITSDLKFENQSILRVDDVCMVEHVLTAKRRSGGDWRLPAMMRIDLNSDGLIKRVNEYLDSRHIDWLAESN